MPDYGIAEALANALKTVKGGDFARAPEAAAARQAAARATPEPVAGGAQSPITPAAPSVNPDMPDLAAPKTPAPDLQAQAAPTPDGAVPVADAAPPVAQGGGYDASSMTPPGDNAVLRGTEGLPDISTAPAPVKPGQSPQAAAGTPPTTPVAPIPPIASAKSPLQAAATTDAQRFVTANVGDFAGKLNLSHMPNVDTISAPQGMKAAILQVADDNAGTIDQARRGTISNEQMLGMAQDLAVNTDMIHTVLNRELGTQFERPETVLAARLIGVNVLGEAQAAAEPLLSGKATAADVLEYARRKQLFTDYQTQLQGGLAEQGRGLQAASIPAPGTLPPEVMDHVAAIIRKNNPNLEQEANSIKMATTPVGIANILSGSLPQRLWQASRSMVTRIFVNGILSGPPTWAKIFVGNNFNLAANTFDIAAAGMVRGTIGLAARLGRFPTSAEGAQMADAFTYAHGVISSGADGLRLAGRTIKTGVSMDNILRFDPSEAGGVRNVNPALGTTQSVLPEIQGTYFGSIARVIDGIIDAPGSRAIGAVDELTKTMGARGYRTMMVMKEIRSQLLDGSLKPGDEGIIAKDMFENPSPEMLQAEEAWAHRMTFQTPFPDDGPGQAFSNLIANNIPALKFVFPFMRTATNIFKQSIGERTPLALLSARIRNQLAAGGFEADLARGRIATGSAIGGMLAWMAVHDQMTGDAPKDPKERALWEADGRTPYSFRITNPTTGEKSWKSYAWFEPMASIAGIVADSANVWSRVNQDTEIDTLKPHGEMYSDMIGHIMGAIITNTANKTFMTGAAKFSEMFSDPQKGFQQWAQDFGTSLVPYSKAIEFSRNITDPYQREAWTLHDKIMNDLPGQSKTLGVQADIFGNPRMNGAPLGRMSPFPSSKDGEDDVTDELRAIMDATHTVPITTPSRMVSMGLGGPGRGILGGSGMPLTSQEYGELVQKSRADPVFDGNTLNLHDKLAQIIQTPTYINSTPAEKAAFITKYASTADQIGRNKLYADNQDFRERITAWADQKARIRTQGQ